MKMMILVDILSHEMNAVLYVILDKFVILEFSNII